MHFFLTRAPFPYSRSVLIALAALVVGGYVLLGQGKNLGATLTIVQGDFRERVSVSGTVTARQSVAVGFAASGRIKGAYVSVGRHVSPGTILAETENGNFFAELEGKRAALKEAQANFALLVAGTRPEELAVTSAAVVNAQAALVPAILGAYTASDDAVHNRTDSFFTNPRTSPKLSFTIANVTLENTLERDRTLIETVLANWAFLITKLSNANAKDTATQAQTYLAHVTTLLADANAALNQGLPDQTTSAATLASYGTALATARTNVNSATTVLAAALAALATAEKSLALKEAGATADAISAQEAAVAAATADVQNAQAALAQTRVAAPFAGIVTRMDAKVGETVSPMTSLISLQSDGLFQIETYVPEVTIARVAVGNPATTTLDAYGSAVAFPAVVVAVDPAETIKGGVPAYKTTLAFLSADPRIRSGMTANVSIETDVLRDTIVIPFGAIGTTNGALYVSVVDRGTVVKRAVTTGPSPALGQSEILSGLSAGDVILLTPAP